MAVLDFIISSTENRLPFSDIFGDEKLKFFALRYNWPSEGMQAMFF